MLKRLIAWILSFCLLVSGVALAEEQATDGPMYLQGASWIWSGNLENNLWVDMIKTFQLDTIPEHAIAEIGAENRYFLYVNGNLAVYDGGLRRGPNPTDGYFDILDLAPYLKTGTNTISLKAWFWGPKGEDPQSYSSVPISTAGVIFAMNLGEETLVSDETWKAKRDMAFLDDTLLGVPQPNFRLPEYNIYYDASLQENEGWLEEDFDASAWPSAEVRGAYGDAPWNALHARPIPLLRVGEVESYVNGADFEGYTTQEDEDLCLVLPFNAQVAPYLEVTAKERAVITITTENTEKAQTVRATYVTRDDGWQCFESPAWISGMQVIYHIPAGVKVERLGYRASGYDADLSGEFTMGDPFFDALYQMGARTQYVCMRENFMDCPDRERAQWTGDATSQMRQMMYCLDPAANALYKKMIAQKVAFVTEGNGKGKLDNLLPTVSPIFGEFYELPAQEMAGIIGVWDNYMYTGDTEVLRFIYEPSLRYLKRWKLSSSGLVKHKTGQGLVDWQDTGAQVDTKVSENAWYYWCLKTLEKMAGVLGEDDTWLRETAEKVQEGYESLWVEGIGYTTTDTPDDRGNALAVLSCLAPEERYPVILNVLETNFRASTYMEAYVLEAMARMGHVDKMLERMEARFGNMVERNLEMGYTTLWEYFEEGMGTWNHAWSASGVYLLPAFVGGIRPLQPGWTECIISPDFSHAESVHVKVSTVLGDIQVDGTQEELIVILPEGMQATVVLVGSVRTIVGEGDEIILREED